MLSTLTEYFIYPAALFSSPALVRKEDTFTSSSGYDRISPALILENASFKQPLRRPYFCLFFVVLIFYLFWFSGPAGIEPTSEAVTSFRRPRPPCYPLHHEPFGGCYSTAEAIGLWPFTSLARCRWRCFMWLSYGHVKRYSALRPTGLNTCEDCFTSRYQFSLFCRIENVSFCLNKSKNDARLGWPCGLSGAPCFDTYCHISAGAHLKR